MRTRFESLSIMWLWEYWMISQLEKVYMGSIATCACDASSMCAIGRRWRASSRPSLRRLFAVSVPSPACHSGTSRASAAPAMPSTSLFGRRIGGRARPWRGLAAVVAVFALMMAAGAAVGLVVRGGGAIGLSGGVSFVLGGLGKTALGMWFGGGKRTAGGRDGVYDDFQTLPSGLRIKDGTWTDAWGWEREREPLVRAGDGRAQGATRERELRLRAGGAARVGAWPMTLWQWVPVAVRERSIENGAL